MLSIKATHQQGAKARLRPAAGGMAPRAPAAPRPCWPHGPARGIWGRAVAGPKAGALVTDVPVLGPIRSTKQSLCRSLGRDNAATGQRLQGPAAALTAAVPSPAHPRGPTQLEAQGHPVPPSWVLWPPKRHSSLHPLPVPRDPWGRTQPSARAPCVCWAAAQACAARGTQGLLGHRWSRVPAQTQHGEGKEGRSVGKRLLLPLVLELASSWHPRCRRAWASLVPGPHASALPGAGSARPLGGHSRAAFPNPPSRRCRPGPAALRRGPCTGPDPGLRARCRSCAAALSRARAKESAQGQQGRICP